MFSHAQAIAAGCTDRMIDVRVRSGRWSIKRRGVYAIAGAPETERQAVMAVCLTSDVGASRLTAARLWGYDFPVPDLIDVAGARVRLEGVRSHQSATLIGSDWARLGALRLTSAPRTLVDCSGTVPAQRLGLIVDDALRRGLVTLRSLRECHERVDTGPGRRPTVALRDVLAERAPGYQPGDSPPEPELLRLVRRHGIPAPVLGHRVRAGNRTYKLDVAWPEAMLGLEYDSWEHHRSFSAFHGDRTRMRRLVALGWNILPVTSKTDLLELIADVAGLLALRWHESTA